MELQEGNIPGEKGNSKGKRPKSKGANSVLLEGGEGEY